MMRRPALILLLCLEAVSFCPPQGPAVHVALLRSLLQASHTATPRSSTSSAASVGSEVALPPRVSRLAYLADPFLGQSRKQPRAEIRTYCPIPVEDCPTAHSLFPPVPREQLPPLIHHINAEDEWPSLVELISTQAGIPESLVLELLRFGAVYLSKPLVPGLRKQRVGLVEGMGKAMRVTTNVPVPRGAYIRVHANPKRHLEANDVDWSNHILAEVHGLVVIDKPAAVPTVPTVDNLVESALSRVQEVVRQPLLSTSRLDTCTSGVVILAKTQEMCEAVNWALRNRQVEKVYRVLCYGPVPLGTLRHCWRKRGAGGHSNGKPSLLAAWDPALLVTPDQKESEQLDPCREAGVLGAASFFHPDPVLRGGVLMSVDMSKAGRSKGTYGCKTGAEWQLAELEVRKCSPLPSVGLLQPGLAGGLFECEVSLITGRTHQVRLQFSASGAPLVGDSRYAPAAGRLEGLGAEEGGNAGFEFGVEPARVGLQAAHVAVTTRDGRHLAFAAGEPWWRDARLLGELLANDAHEAQARLGTDQARLGSEVSACQDDVLTRSDVAPLVESLSAH